MQQSKSMQNWQRIGWRFLAVLTKRLKSTDQTLKLHQMRGFMPSRSRFCILQVSRVPTTTRRLLNTTFARGNPTKNRTDRMAQEKVIQYREVEVTQLREVFQPVNLRDCPFPHMEEIRQISQTPNESQPVPLKDRPLPYILAWMSPKQNLVVMITDPGNGK